MPSGIGNFDVRDRSNYVFTASDPVELRQAQQTQEKEREAPATVATGANPYQFLFSGDSSTGENPSTPKCLWAVIEGKRFEVKHDGALIVPEGRLALSPDAGSVVTKLTVQEIPSGWEKLYPPPYPVNPIDYNYFRSQDVRQYAVIDVRTGSIQALTDAPVAEFAGWWWGGDDNPSWSDDGQEVLLPGTFVKSNDKLPSKPCVAVVSLHSKAKECVEVLKDRAEKVVHGHAEIHRENGFHSVSDVHFEGPEVMVDFTTPIGSKGRFEYSRTANGEWQVVREIKGSPKVERHGLQVEVEEGLNEPPRLVGRQGKGSRVIWDPNPQLKDVALGQVDIYAWEDKEGRHWKGGLFKPVGYVPERSYPLVIQTHGFAEDEFRPSGIFPTAFAARALAAHGIIVLQMAAAGPDDCTGIDEGLCVVSMLESGANKLISDGLADQERIGAIGFSRTCFQLMEELTTGSLHLKAASITDGIMFGYFEYVLTPERIDVESNELIGPSPFRGGMQQWIKRSPGFSLDKINTPLLIVGEGQGSLLGMWEPYSGLHYLKRPVDLVLLNTNEHVLTNPAVRMASQGGSVDWFRFWLQGYEDPDPAKADQYKRWREMRKLQAENNKKQITAPADSN